MTNTKYHNLQNILKQMDSVLIAFSGGVDSTFLLRVAADVLGNNVLAVTALSETTPRHEQEDAISFAKSFGVKHLTIRTHELDIPEFVKNPTDKCYICKKSRFSSLVKMAQEKGFSFVADGENADDTNDYRPGSKAARELGVRSPLREAGLTKDEIRQISKQLNLPTWNKPAYACLATRIPYHSPITAEKLKQIDAGEDFIRSLGLSEQVRVRHYGDTARIETDPNVISAFAETAVRNRIVSYFKALGFQFITLDLEGYRMGSMNKGVAVGS